MSGDCRSIQRQPIPVGRQQIGHVVKKRADRLKAFVCPLHKVGCQDLLIGKTMPENELFVPQQFHSGMVFGKTLRRGLELIALHSPKRFVQRRRRQNRVPILVIGLDVFANALQVVVVGAKKPTRNIRIPRHHLKIIAPTQHRLDAIKSACEPGIEGWLGFVEAQIVVDAVQIVSPAFGHDAVVVEHTFAQFPRKGRHVVACHLVFGLVGVEPVFVVVVGEVLEELEGGWEDHSEEAL
jgi:hypothetical protein